MVKQGPVGGSSALVVAALAALALGACGGDDEPPGVTAPAREPAPPAEGDGETAPETTPGRRPDAGGARPEGSGGPCVYEAPPGRLGRDEVPVELTGVGCAQGTRLARAGALGQPAGANLAFDRDGFRCEPSTRTKGENVTYTCRKGEAEVRFEVLWTVPGG